MSGTGNSTTTVFASGDPFLDGILTNERWADATVEFSFPSSNSVYSYDTYSSYTDYVDQFVALTTAQQNASFFALDADNGVNAAASAGFSVEGFTALELVYDSTPDSVSGYREEIRIANTLSTYLGTAQAGDFPGNDVTFDTDDNGDVWFGPYPDGLGGYIYRTPQAGNYAWATHIHELGHALGLSHGHSTWEMGTAMPYEYDSMEYSIMTYRSYVGGPTTGYTNETWGYAQTWMMADIAALQYMYGADFSTNSGNTVYSWAPGSGDTLVNGQVAIDAGGNVIFATIWDGGGIDTYDLSAYTNGVSIDLRPGMHSVFDETQLAELGFEETARGSIFNALQYQDDPRSLIENAIGGSGDDAIMGNAADNALQGGLGNDTLTGDIGDDTLQGNSGSDSLVGGDGFDWLEGGDDADTLRGMKNGDTVYGGNGDDTIYGGNGHDDLFGEADNDRIYGHGGADLLEGGIGGDRIFGGRGDDTLLGGNGYDRLFGSKGRDTLNGGVGNDTLTGGTWADTFVFDDGFGHDIIRDFAAADLEKIDLSGVTGITDYDDLINNHLVDEGGFAKIVDGDNSILIEGVSYTDMRDGLNGYTADDFIF